MDINNLLSRLEGVKSTGKYQWVAKCPAHNDRRPSLSVKLADNGYLLLKCFGGCSVNEVLNACGLEMSDLFPDDGTFSRGSKRAIPAMQVLKALAHEFRVIAMGAEMLVNGSITETDGERIRLASQRILDGLEAAGVSYE